MVAEYGRPGQADCMIRQKRVFSPERVKLGKELRQNRSMPMKLRRAALGLDLAATGVLGIISLYQTGLVRHLPDPPLRRFRADAVSATGEGYLFQIPDALLGMTSYLVTASLVFAGPPERARTHWYWPAAAMAKSLFDAAYSVRLALIQHRDLRLYCAYCLTTTALSLAVVPLTAPEGARAIRKAYRGEAEARAPMP